MKHLATYSIGTGDRFGREGEAQIAAVSGLEKRGVKADIVWNKSNREHLIVGTTPEEQRKAADAAVRATGWKGGYFVDADHIGMGNVDKFIPWCDFFTIDVADFIGKPVEAGRARAFAEAHRNLAKPGAAPVPISMADMEGAAGGFLRAIDEAAKVYARISEGRPDGDFAVEISMDETADPQTPAELAVILAAISDAKIPVQTIAPKFSGRFNKGVDYVGDVGRFLKEFESDALVARWAAEAFGLPAGLKLSIHSGSDKFSLYRGTGEIVRRLGCGLHLKTAGTSWLEELIGLAEAGGEGLAIAKRIYAAAYARYDELAAPYASVIDISPGKLPAPAEVSRWTSAEYVGALRHEQSDPAFNADLRQLLHVAYKVAAEMGGEYMDALAGCKEHIARNVCFNLFERHLKPLFLGEN